MRRTKEDAEQTRQSIFEAAIVEFSRKGYTAARLENIAAAANVTRGAVYHHYNGGKTELFANIIDKVSENAGKVTQHAIQEGGTFLDIIRRILTHTLDLLANDYHFRAAMSLLIFNSGDSPDLIPLRTTREEQGLVQLEQIVGFFQMALEQSEVRADLDPEVAARAFLAYQNGLVLLYLSSPRAIDIDKHAAGLAEIYVRGISAK